MRVIVAGNNKVAVEVLEWLVRRGEEVVATVPEGHDLTDKDENWEKPFTASAQRFEGEHGVPCFVGNVNRYVGQLESLRPDLLVFCRSVALVRSAILKLPSRGCTNLHYGELPRYGGCSTLQWAILNGEDHVGITLHFMTEKFDEGPIIDQKTFDISGKTRTLRLPDRTLKVRGLTAFEIYQQANALAVEMFQENYPRIKNGGITGYPQDHSGKTYYSKESLNLETDRYIDIKAASDETIARHVRAFTFPPKQLPIGKVGKEMWGELILH